MVSLARTLHTTLKVCTYFIKDLNLLLSASARVKDRGRLPIHLYITVLSALVLCGYQSSIEKSGNEGLCI